MKSISFDSRYLIRCWSAYVEKPIKYIKLIYDLYQIKKQT